MRNIAVAIVDRRETGTHYVIADDDNRIVADVDYFNGVYGMHDRDGEPIRVGSPLYDTIIRTIRHYTEWSESH